MQNRDKHIERMPGECDDLEAFSFKPLHKGIVRIMVYLQHTIRWKLSPLLFCHVVDSDRLQAPDAVQQVAQPGVARAGRADNRYAKSRGGHSIWIGHFPIPSGCRLFGLVLM